MLRYPGGKLRLMKKINVMIKETYPESSNSSWVVSEPFVGGGGSLINMAEDFPSWTFNLNDLNKDVASLWKFFKSASDSDFELLYDKISTQKVDILNYKKIFDSKPISLIDRAFRVIFLNKTSFNGLITLPRPIGGWNQKSKWGVDVYWTPKTIIKKIDRARKSLKDRIISVSTEDFETFLNKTKSDFIYADPPYIAWGKQWYGCTFGLEDLSRLQKVISKKERWCLSIDRNPETEAVFKEDTILGIDIRHTAKSCYKSKRTDPTTRSIEVANELVVFPEGVLEKSRSFF